MTPDLIRERSGTSHHRVAFVELFFDLVFVFAVTQLSHLLLAHLTPAGTAQAAFLLVAIWWAWIYTTWATNWLRAERTAVRLLFFGMMLAGLVLAAALPGAFAGHGLAFALAYVALQVGRTAFMVWALRGHDDLRRNFIRILAWMLLAAPLWVGGALAGPAGRWTLWLLALGFEFVGPVVRFWMPGMGHSEVRTWNVEGGHMAERCGLFMIIALGESIILTGATLAGSDWSAPVSLAFVLAFAGSVAMWWFYFDATAEAGSQALTATDNPGRIARLGYTYIHLFMVAGIVAWAVGNELVLAHPGGHTDLATAACVLGGAALMLTGTALFKRVIGGVPCKLPLVMSGLLVLAVPVVGALPPLAVLALASASVAGIAIIERHAPG